MFIRHADSFRNLFTAFLAITMVHSSIAVAAPENTPSKYANAVQIMPLDFNLRQKVPSENKPWYGWQLFSWKHWLQRPSSGPLLVQMPANHPALGVFEARFAAVLNQPITRFTERYLHNIATIDRVDPNDLHKQIASPNSFSIETIVPFPNNWAKMIAVGKAAQILSARSSDHLEMMSVFGFLSSSQIRSDQKIQKIVKLLDVTGRTPDAINIQGILDINEIAQFGSMITFFYKLSPQKTLLVSDFALGLKKKILDLGFDMGRLNFTGKSVILGQNPLLNTSSGIGAGLPEYTEELFLNMAHGYDE